MAPSAQSMCPHADRRISWSNHGPVMVHLPFLRLTERVSGSHPHRIVSVSYGRVAPFHGGNAGSNPAGDAKLFQVLTSISSPSQISLVALG